MSRVRRAAPFIVAVLAVVVIAGAAQPQGNIDAGKTPAQMFSDTCATCHRRAQDLKRGASAGFLRQHYMTGSQQAAAMASYLAALPATKDRGKDRDKDRDRDRDKDKARLQQQQAQEKAKAPPTKGRRAEIGKAAEPPEPPQETQPQTQTHAEAPAVPKLEPFLE